MEFSNIAVEIQVAKCSQKYTFIKQLRSTNITIDQMGNMQTKYTSHNIYCMFPTFSPYNRKKISTSFHKSMTGSISGSIKIHNSRYVMLKALVQREILIINILDIPCCK